MPVYSHSRLSSFEKCPLQYRFRYLDRIKRDTQGIEAFMGNRVHDVLERLYQDLLASKRPSLDELVTLYRRSWDAEFSPKVTIVKTQHTAEHYRDIGQACVETYYNRNAPFDQTRTVGLEERIFVTLDDSGRYQIQGYIDRLAMAGDGVYEVHDYKTSSSLPPESVLRRDRQLTLYHMGVRARFKEAREIRLVWHYLVHDRVLTSQRTEADVEQHRKQTIGLIDVIEAAKTFPAKVGVLCAWCEYRDICPEFAPARPVVPAAAQTRAVAAAPAAAPAPKSIFARLAELHAVRLALARERARIDEQEGLLAVEIDDLETAALEGLPLVAAERAPAAPPAIVLGATAGAIATVTAKSRPSARARRTPLAPAGQRELF